MSQAPRDSTSSEGTPNQSKNGQDNSVRKSKDEGSKTENRSGVLPHPREGSNVSCQSPSSSSVPLGYGTVPQVPPFSQPGFHLQSLNWRPLVQPQLGAAFPPVANLPQGTGAYFPPVRIDPSVMELFNSPTPPVIQAGMNPLPQSFTSLGGSTGMPFTGSGVRNCNASGPAPATTDTVASSTGPVLTPSSLEQPPSLNDPGASTHTTPLGDKGPAASTTDSTDLPEDDCASPPEGKGSPRSKTTRKRKKKDIDPPCEPKQNLVMYHKPAPTTNPQILERRERKNFLNRFRAKQYKDRIDQIIATTPHKRSVEEQHDLEVHEERRRKKNERSRARSTQKQRLIDRILAKSEAQRSKAETAFLEHNMAAKERKNEGDRLRRERLKQELDVARSNQAATLSHGSRMEAGRAISGIQSSAVVPTFLGEDSRLSASSSWAGSGSTGETGSTMIPDESWTVQEQEQGGEIVSGNFSFFGGNKSSGSTNSAGAHCQIDNNQVVDDSFCLFQHDPAPGCHHEF